MFSVIRRSHSVLLTNFVKNLFKPKEITPIVLFDGSALNDKWGDDWECTSDNIYGGPSVSDLSFEVPEDGTYPYLRFKGSLDMTTRKAQELNVAGGFCALRWLEFAHLNLYETKYLFIEEMWMHLKIWKILLALK